jgi:hypothetical protein
VQSHDGSVNAFENEEEEEEVERKYFSRRKLGSVLYCETRRPVARLAWCYYAAAVERFVCASMICTFGVNQTSMILTSRESMTRRRETIHFSSFRLSTQHHHHHVSVPTSELLQYRNVVNDCCCSCSGHDNHNIIKTYHSILSFLIGMVLSVCSSCHTGVGTSSRSRALRLGGGTSFPYVAWSSTHEHASSSTF